MKLLLSALLFLAASAGFAADHTIPAGRFADLKYKVECGDIVKVRVTPAPPQKADGLDPGRFLFAGEAGKTYSVRGYIINFKTEKFEDVDDTVTFGEKAVPPPNPKNPDPKVTDSKEPVSPKLYFVVVRPDGPATPAFIMLMQNPGWTQLRAEGHTVKDFTVSEAVASLPVELGATPLPAVVTLAVAKDGKSHHLYRTPSAAPTTAEEILRLKNPN
ncbi:MAG TPA: hypothetical protein VD866_08835 [Urbifossiella sp.]|nr:hypothetical protein [Urbifossiella sp.]